MGYIYILEVIGSIIIILVSIAGNLYLKKHTIELSKELPRINEVSKVVEQGIKQGVNIENLLFPNSPLTPATKEISNIIINSINSIDQEMLKKDTEKSINVLGQGIQTEIKKRIAKG